MIESSYICATQKKLEDMTNIRLGDAIELLKKENKYEQGNCIWTGIKDLDEVTKTGWWPGELCIIGARPGIGRMPFIYSIMANLALSNIPVAIFSSKDTLNFNFISGLQRIAKVGSEFDTHPNPVTNEEFQSLPIYLNLERNLTLDYIRENALKLVQDMGVKCIFIEKLHTIFYSEPNGQTPEGMDRICHELKQIALDLQIPLIVTSDLNRGPEYREGMEGKCPVMGDLRACGAIENEADSVYLLDRSEYYHLYQDNHGRSLRGVMTVHVRNKMYGETGSVHLKYDALNHRVTSIPGGFPCIEEAQSHFESKKNFNFMVDTLDLEEDCPF